MTTGVLTVTVHVDPELKRALKHATNALFAAGLEDSADQLCTRLLKSERRFLAIVGTCGEVQVSLRPFAELALREIAHIARLKIDPPSKRRRITEILTLAGY